MALIGYRKLMALAIVTIASSILAFLGSIESGTY